LIAISIKTSGFGYYIDQVATREIDSLLDRQLLLQLGDRIRNLRRAQALGTAEVAARAGITRNTLRAVESGDPATAIGTYIRVMSILGVSGEIALLAGDTLQPPPTHSAAARSHRAAPNVQVRVSADDSRHRLQDLQSLALHEAAVRLVKSDPHLVEKARSTVLCWLATGDVRAASLWREWLKILDSGAWRKALGRSRHAQQLRQASPLVTVLPESVRESIYAQVADLKKGVVLNSESAPPDRS
jgi:transcriptional regulator with XRE-family HTH domain